VFRQALRRKIWLPVAGILAVILLVVGCGGGDFTQSTTTPSTISGNITIKGSDTMVNLGARWAEEFMKDYPKVSISVTGGGSGTGIAALINKTTDICQASRKMTTDEIAQAEKNGVEPVEFVVALDGLSVVVNPSNSISELTFQQLSDIYTGKLTNWKNVGGKDASIVALSRDTNSGTHVFFKEYVVQMAGLPTQNKKLEYGSKVLMMPSSKTGITEVAQNSNAIFYVGMGYVTDEVKVIKIKRTETDTAIVPSILGVRNGSYPVSRPLYLYTNGQPMDAIKAYVDWVMGTKGQQIVTKLDFVTLK